MVRGRAIGRDDGALRIEATSSISEIACSSSFVSSFEHAMSHVPSTQLSWLVRLKDAHDREALE